MAAFKKNSIEQAAWKLDQLVCGIDEAGRGCLAGPVVVGAVILPLGKAPAFLKDSKIMSHLQRETAYEWIVQNCIWTVAFAGHTIIDSINIYQASKQAMYQAYSHIKFLLPPENKLTTVAVDAMPLILESGITVHSLTQGESKSSSIAAASIIAKVTRDRILNLHETVFACHQLSTHKGYATAQHVQTLKEHGKSLIHRESFLGLLKKGSDENGTNTQQTSLFGPTTTKN